MLRPKAIFDFAQRTWMVWLPIVVLLAVGVNFAYFYVYPIYSSGDRLMCDSVEVPLVIVKPNKKLKRQWYAADGSSGPGSGKWKPDDIEELIYPLEVEFLVIRNNGDVISPVWRYPGKRYHGNFSSFWIISLPTTYLSPPGRYYEGIRKVMSIDLPRHEEIQEIVLLVKERRKKSDPEYQKAVYRLLSIPKSRFNEVYQSGIEIPVLETLPTLDTDPRKSDFLDAYKRGLEDYERYFRDGGMNGRFPFK